MSLSEPRNRFNALVSSTSTLNGVDYVELDATDATVLYVHFLNASVQPLPALLATITGGDRIPTVPVLPIDPATDWSQDADGRPLLTLQLPPQVTGDFSTYTLTLTAADPAQDSKLDRIYTSAEFSFKVLCPSDFDCQPPAHVCPADDTVPPAIDYTAKDFGSFVAALSAFSAQAYPGWQERSEADIGMVVMESLAALADELSYYQDRVAAEAALHTATQRRSLVSLARLVDYEPTSARSATTTLICTVGSTSVPAGVQINAIGADGELIPFEIGTGLNDTTAYPASPGWNYPIPAYWWDDDEQCLPAGATEIWVQGDAHGFVVGMQILIRTDLPAESLRQVVTVTAVEPALDQVFQTGGLPTRVTRLAWSAADQLLRERNLPLTNVGGNIMPATQGARVSESFGIDTPPTAPPTPSPLPPGTPFALARRGPNATDAAPNWIYRRPLARSPIAWLAPPTGAMALPLTAANALAPELVLNRVKPAQGVPWSFTPTLLDADSLETAFTIDPVAWRVIATNPDGSAANYEMDGDGGESLRFGDGVFGLPPDAGDLFTVTYRVGLGSAGNVPADSINQVDPAWGGILLSAANPFAAAGGADAETPAHIRHMAPYQFQATQFRAVRSDDYVAAAQTLPWVYKAGSAFRWTGSWLSVFTVADPAGAEATSADEHLQLVDLLNRRRLAGYESFALPPTYVSIDLTIMICATSAALRSDVEVAVLARLGGADRSGDTAGFFFADRFTFGTPLFRSALEAAIQGVAGVNGVLSIEYRERGVTTGWLDLPTVFPLGADRILRIDNDSDWPERGTITVVVEGGR